LSILREVLAEEVSKARNRGMSFLDAATEACKRHNIQNWREAFREIGSILGKRSHRLHRVKPEEIAREIARPVQMTMFDAGPSQKEVRRCKSRGCH